MSKFMYFDFRCESCGNRTEAFVKPDVRTMSCPNCGGSAKRLISKATISLSGTDPAFGTAYDKWERVQKQKVANDKKFYADHGEDKPR
jgi:putative FmdB family regulatory protein